MGPLVGSSSLWPRSHAWKFLQEYREVQAESDDRREAVGESCYYSDPICLCSIWLQSEQVGLVYLIYRFVLSVW